MKKQERGECLFDPSAPLTILRLRKGSLHADFKNGFLPPGIYGTIWHPVELLDALNIENGVNVADVRIAGQFSLSQKSFENLIKGGSQISLTSSLIIYISG